MHTRAQLICGIGAGVTGLVGAVAATFLPLGGGGGGTVIQVFPDGTTQTLATFNHTANLVQSAGLEIALGFLATFTILSLWNLWAIIGYARHPRGGALPDLWAVTAVWFLVIVIGAPLFGILTTTLVSGSALLLMPSALLALACAIVASVRQRGVVQG